VSNASRRASPRGEPAERGYGADDERSIVNMVPDGLSRKPAGEHPQSPA
jgi:hypothetical protein